METITIGQFAKRADVNIETIRYYEKEMTQGMSNMIRQIAGVMSQDMTRERRHMTSEMMRDVAAEMNRISFMLDRGNVTEEEMKDLENRMIEIQKHMPDIIK